MNCEDLKGVVTAMEIRPTFKEDMDTTHVAVGYSEGTLVLYDLNTGEPVKFNGMIIVDSLVIFYMEIFYKYEVFEYGFFISIFIFKMKLNINNFILKLKHFQT